MVLTFSDVVERGWGLTGGSNVRQQQVRLLGVFVFPVVLAEVIARYPGG